MTITIVMSTWDDGTGIRVGYAEQATKSLAKYYSCFEEGTKFLLADDGSEDAASKFAETLERAYDRWPEVAITSPVHNGIGSSLNHALEEVGSEDLWLYTTDDWVINREVNLDQAVRLLRNGYDYVRVGPIHPNLECVTRFQQGIGYWVEFVNDTGFAFATRPFLATKQFYNKVGKFLEGANSYVVEQDYSLRCIRMRHQLKLGAVTIGGHAWEHIGDYEVGKYDIR